MMTETIISCIVCFQKLVFLQQYYVVVVVVVAGESCQVYIELHVASLCKA